MPQLTKDFKWNRVQVGKWTTGLARLPPVSVWCPPGHVHALDLTPVAAKSDTVVVPAAPAPDGHNPGVSPAPEVAGAASAGGSGGSADSAACQSRDDCGSEGRDSGRKHSSLDGDGSVRSSLGDSLDDTTTFASTQSPILAVAGMRGLEGHEAAQKRKTLLADECRLRQRVEDQAATELLETVECVRMLQAEVDKAEAAKHEAEAAENEAAAKHAVALQKQRRSKEKYRAAKEKCSRKREALHSSTDYVQQTTDYVQQTRAKLDAAKRHRAAAEKQVEFVSKNGRHRHDYVEKACRRQPGEDETVEEGPEDEPEDGPGEVHVHAHTDTPKPCTVSSHLHLVSHTWSRHPEAVSPWCLPMCPARRRRSRLGVRTRASRRRAIPSSTTGKRGRRWAPA